MQVKSSPTQLEYFKQHFKALDDAVLISPEQWATLTGQSRASVYSAKQRANLPIPAIQKNRFVRWTAGQYRAWASSLATAEASSPSKSRLGRPRTAIEQKQA